MAFPQGINFRATSGFVTDPTNYNAEIGATANYPRTTAQGNTVGWEDAAATTRDRSSGIDARIAGVNSVSGGTCRYRIDLPSAGTYNVQAGFGDAGSSHLTAFTITFQDTTTVLATPASAATVAINNWISANGTTRTSAASWATNNPNAGGGADEISLTFATTIFRTSVVGNAQGTPISSLYIAAAGGGGDTLFGGMPLIFV